VKPTPDAAALARDLMRHTLHGPPPLEMSDRPTLYLSNFASHRSPGKWSPAPYAPLTIMTRPRHFERGAGRVDALVPTAERDLLARALADRLDVAAMAAYREALTSRWSTLDLSPGVLTYTPTNRPDPRVVLPGMTLCCACSVAEARAGRCHRSWAAPFLHRAGWAVVLDGVEAGLEAAAQAFGESPIPGVPLVMFGDAIRAHIEALDPEAIARGGR
jgi:hypothetical protein